MSGEALQRLYEKRCSCGSGFETGFKEVPLVYAGTQVRHRPAETEASAAPARTGQVAGRASRENVSGISGRCWRLSERSCAPVSSLQNRTLQVLVQPTLLPTDGRVDLLKLILCKRCQKKAVN